VCFAARMDHTRLTSDNAQNSLTVDDVDSTDMETGANKIAPLIETARRVDKKLSQGELKFSDFLDFSHAFEETLGALGTAFKLGKKDFGNNIRKMTDAQQTLAAKGLSRKPTCKEFLQAEKDTGIHKSGGKLDHSGGADGMLWIRRSCQWVLAIMAELVNGQPSLYEAAKAGYKKELAVYHGWFLQKVFGGVMWNLPSKESFCRNLLDDESSPDKVVMTLCKSQMHELTVAANPMLEVLVGIFMSLDLEDLRKI